MSQQPIIAVGESAAVVLSPTVLEAIGLRVGDVVEVTWADGQLILRPVDDARRRQQVEEITQEVFDRRRDAYQRLA